MRTRFGFIIFCVMLAWGFWAQRRYMDVSRQEFLAETKADRSRSQLLAAKQFMSFNYEAGALVSSVRADSGLMLNSGESTLTGNVKYIEMDQKQNAKLVVSTPTANCQLEVSRPNRDFFDTTRKLDKVHLPDKVEARTVDDYLQTSNVFIDFETDLLTTDAPVSILGPSRVMDAMGFSYNLKTTDFKLLKNIRGHYIPARGKK